MLRPLYYTVFILFACAMGCITPGQDRPGKIIERPDTNKETRAKAITTFNKGNQTLVSAFDEEGVADTKVVEEAIKCYLESLTIDPSFADAAKQLGVVYEFVVFDEMKALEYYKKYRDLSPGGIDESILYFINKFETQKEKNESEPSKE